MMQGMNNWLSVGSNVAVVLGIVFLAYEIRQNTEATHAQTRETVLAATQAELQAIREDPNLIRSIIKEEPLSAEEQVTLYVWLVSALRVREFSWLQRRSGVIDEAQWQSELAVMTAIMQAPRVRLWWSQVGHKTVGPEFRDYVNELVEQVPPSNGIYEEQTRWANEAAWED